MEVINSEHISSERASPDQNLKWGKTDQVPGLSQMCEVLKGAVRKSLSAVCQRCIGWSGKKSNFSTLQSMAIFSELKKKIFLGLLLPWLVLIYPFVERIRMIVLMG